MKTVYLDNAATTKMRPQVVDLISKSMQDSYANASSTYSIARTVKSAIELVRKQVAKQLGVSGAEIIYTSGGTEANNIILQAAIQSLGVTRIITSKIEHHAVLKTVDALTNKYPIAIEYVGYTNNGDIDLDSLEEKMASSNAVTLVSLMHINNEIGTVLDLEAVGLLCENHQAYFHTDSVQSVGHYAIDFKKSKVHFATASAHKFYGPKGIGFAYISSNLNIKPTIFGGEQERGLRPGTEPVSLILGMGKALELAYSELEKDKSYLEALKEYAVNQLKVNFDNIQFNAKTNEGNRNYNLLSVRLPISSEKASTVLFQLDLAGICCSRGSACQSGSNKPSHVLAEILTPEERKFTSLRFSFSIYNTMADIDYLVAQLQKIIS